MKEGIGLKALSIVASSGPYLDTPTNTPMVSPSIPKLALATLLMLGLMFAFFFILKRIGRIWTIDGSTLYLRKIEMEWLERQLEKFRMQAKSLTVSEYYRAVISNLRNNQLNLSQLRLIGSIYNLGIRQIAARIKRYTKDGNLDKVKQLLSLQKVLINAYDRITTILFMNQKDQTK